ncbi:MAG TPA: hypothetical protein VGL83_02295 [Stellaceae bacterium]|jgi:hypothetical protein
MPVAEDLIGLAARVVLHQVVAPSRTGIKRRIIGATVCGVLAAMAGLGALGWASAALWLWLATVIGPARAALVVAVVLLAGTFIFGFAARRIARAPRAPALASVLNSKELAGMFEHHVPQLVIAAAIGGLLLGMRRRK